MKFNFKNILNEIFEPFKIYLFSKFLGISLSGQNVRTTCDCDMYKVKFKNAISNLEPKSSSNFNLINKIINIQKDTSFIIENLPEIFKNEDIPDGDFLNLQCFIGSSQTPVKIFAEINQNQVTKTQFCPNKTETTTAKATVVSKKTQTSTRTTKELSKNVSLAKSTTTMSHTSENKTKSSGPRTSPSLTTLITPKKSPK